MVKRDIRDYLQDILTYISLAEQFIEGLTFDELQADDKTTLALTRAVEIIGEAAKQIPTSLREQYPEISWKNLVGMRDRLAHVYFGIDLDVVWSTTKEDLPKLKPVIQAMLNKLIDSDGDY
jgi:uncharacterized protein with HEPN domain